MNIGDTVVCISNDSAGELIEGSQYIILEIGGENDGDYLFGVKGVDGSTYTELYWSWRFSPLMKVMP